MAHSIERVGRHRVSITDFLFSNLSFMGCYLLAPMQVEIAQALTLNFQQRALLVATPILAGALLTLGIDRLIERMDAKRVGLLVLTVLMFALIIAWQIGRHSVYQTLLLSIFLGGAATLPVASRRHLPQAGAIGFADAGSIALMPAFTPMLTMAFGWRNVFGFICIPLVFSLAAFWIIPQKTPHAARQTNLTKFAYALRGSDTWWLMLFSAITFGGFSGLACTLPTYFHDQFNFDVKVAGLYTAACMVAGTVMHSLGGMIAKKIGGLRLLSIIYAAAALLMLMAGFSLSGVNGSVLLFLLTMLYLGAGNGAVFQLLIERSIKNSTVLANLAGGISSFLLVIGLGASKQISGGYSIGLWVFASFAFVAWLGTHSLEARWNSEGIAPTILQ